MARSPREQTIETYPEADRLEPFPHPRHTKKLFGHREQIAELAQGLESGRLHHAWLLTGPAGVGKATLAYHFARRALLGSDAGLLPDNQMSPFDVPANASVTHLVAALSHPDLLVLRRPYDIRAKRLKTALTVDEVRRLRDFLGHKQSGVGLKVVIVDSADDLNVNAANALLKSLEEPPSGVIFMLVSSMPGRLLTTIRSRCRTLVFDGLAPDDLRNAAQQALVAGDTKPPMEDDWPALMREADGSVRRVLRLASEDGLALSKKVDRLFQNVRQIDWGEVHQLSDEFSAVAAADKFEAFSDLLLARLARIIQAAARGTGDQADLKDATALGVGQSLASWAELWETLVRDKATQSVLNLDRKAYLMDTIRRMGELTVRS